MDAKKTAYERARKAYGDTVRHYAELAQYLGIWPDEEERRWQAMGRARRRLDAVIAAEEERRSLTTDQTQ